MVELFIFQGNTIYSPCVIDGIQWSTYRQGVCGELSFSIVKDENLIVEEGDVVQLKIDGEGIFFGFVFTKKMSKSASIEITAYDQLRYLKNNFSYCYESKTASDVVRFIASDFFLNLGTIENTSYLIPSRVEDNTTLFDMIQTALDSTIENTGEMFILYDDFGQLTLKNISSLIIPILIGDNTAEDYDYSSSIDGETYNQIHLVYTDEDTNEQYRYISSDSTNIEKWGLLQYFDTLNNMENGKYKADCLLSLMNKKSRSLSLKNCFGDVRVRGGSLVGVNLKVDDVEINQFMLVEEVKHNFQNGIHLMDLEVKGGEIS